MLKALELVGFKSFADRTRFDFPDGITVVVGPNGSGKSNVVDAIKWVLGAQSAKSLRGAEMTDVIFKGSAEGGRKPANSAEVVLILDNRSRSLTMDADEIHVCRRVYRNGEGEYAINGQPCRLKDVRDLFRGTGVGVDSYSLIEQGKVDRLLQSSPRDRRAIFEEAAGISRFKAKKSEAERRLLRVDQNMLRIRDMVDELGKRLSTLKQQASKAQRYREWTAQSMRLRTQLGRLELQELETQVLGHTQKIDEAAQLRNECTTQVEAIQQKLGSHQEALSHILSEIDLCGGQFSERQREHVQACSERTLNEQRQQEWANERSTLIERIESLERRVVVGEEEILDRNRNVEQQRIECEQAQQRAAELELEVRHCDEQLIQSRRTEAAVREKMDSLRQRLSRLQSDASSQFKALESSEVELLRIQEQIREKSDWIDQVQRDLEKHHHELDSSRQEYSAAEAAKQMAKKSHEETLERGRQQQQVCLELQTRIQGLSERLTFLAQLEDQFTNAGRGGQQLVRSANELVNSHPSFQFGQSSILGLVADLITTDLHLAPLVDVALGSYADAIVLGDGQLIDWINEGRLTPDGRVTLLRMDRLPTRRTGEKIQLDGLRGVVGRADRLVRFQSGHEPLVRALLGTTWFVESLATALDLSHFRGAGLRFVTAECQLVDSDGSITIGSLQAGLGLVSRRSEMQVASEQRDTVQVTLLGAKQALEVAELELRQSDDHVHQCDQQVVDAARKVAAVEQKINSVQFQLQNDIDLLSKLRTDLEACSKQRDSLDLSLATLDQERIELQKEESSLESQLTSVSEEIQDRESKYRDSQQRMVDHRIEAARHEQRLDGLRLTLEQLLHDASERTLHVQTARDQLSHLDDRITNAATYLKVLSERIRELDTALVAAEQKRLDWLVQREAEQQKIDELSRQMDQFQRQLEKHDDRIASWSEERERLLQTKENLIARYREEYQMDLLQTNTVEEHTESRNRSDIEADLAHLRQEIAAAGSVNMEALGELDQLQQRYDRLAGQEQDLIDAKEGLIRTMQKIDEDSRSLFSETLETIRSNFQQLYRKSFGGGMADIVLENPEDPESGIEILATPPGKTTFSNSLLSGGEKALTAVSLIMAFFQYRPSPFCILDEVDAPFDEANIGRFVAVLNEFLASTKFIVVTHSKKTMTVANTIYGVTMQESGVSRQVAVRFEEVNDRGEILHRESRRAA
jgi:chromosome segregation protein